MPDYEIPHRMMYIGPECPLTCFRSRDRSCDICSSPGEPCMLLTGPDFILVRDPLFSALRDLCSHCLQFRRVYFPLPPHPHGTPDWGDYEGEEGADYGDFPAYFDLPPYFEVMAQQELSPQSISSLDVSGFQVWSAGPNCLFVSPSLMRELSRRGFDELGFSPGFTVVPDDVHPTDRDRSGASAGRASAS